MRNLRVDSPQEALGGYSGAGNCASAFAAY